MSETTKEILHRITSPWFFTFIPWWVVFNYDFLILVFGKVETLKGISAYYCGTENLIYTVGGCFDVKRDWWMEPILRKLGWPILVTVVSMAGLMNIIHEVEKMYAEIKKREKSATLQALNEWCNYLLRGKRELIQQHKKTIEELKESHREKVADIEFYNAIIQNPTKNPNEYIKSDTNSIVGALNTAFGNANTLTQGEENAVREYLQTLLHETFIVDDIRNLYPILPDVKKKLITKEVATKIVRYAKRIATCKTLISTITATLNT